MAAHQHRTVYDKTCKACISQETPIPVRLGGIPAIPFRIMGIKRSLMNPNVCSACVGHFEKPTNDVINTAVVPITSLFADLRGYTSFSAKASSTEIIAVLDRFYSLTSDVIWKYDGVVNKFIGDAVFAIFNFPIFRPDHTQQAVACAVELQQRSSELFPEPGEGHQQPEGLGIGVHTGEATVGLFGAYKSDATAIGDVVNISSRLQSAAGPGTVLVSSEVYESVRDRYPGAEPRDLHLKGIDDPITAYSIST